jgi:hypothetical protein
VCKLPSQRPVRMPVDKVPNTMNPFRVMVPPEVGLPRASALQSSWANYAIALAMAIVPGVAAAVDVFRPKVLVMDQLALADGATTADHLEKIL